MKRPLKMDLSCQEQFESFGYEGRLSSLRKRIANRHVDETVTWIMCCCAASCIRKVMDTAQYCTVLSSQANILGVTCASSLVESSTP